MKLASILWIGLMTVFSSTGFAEDRPTQDSQFRLIQDLNSAEDVRVHNLGSILQVYVQNHGNNLPSTWSELNAYIPLDGLGKPPIQECYALVPSASPSEDLGGAQVIAIGVAPSTDAVEKGQGRFILYRTKDGGYFQGWYPELKVQKIIAQTHIAIPPAVTPSPGDPRPPSTTNAQVQVNNVAPPQTTFPETTSPVPTTSSPMPKSTTEVAPVNDAGIPWWLYGVFVASLGVIVALWYRSQPKK